MNDSEIEEEIQCTIDQEETALADLRHSVAPILCACGQSFQHDEKGISVLLKKCHTCFTALRADLGDKCCDTANNPGLTSDAPCGDVPCDEAPIDNPFEGPNVDYAAINETPPPDPIASEPNVAPTEEFVLGAMTMAVADSNKSFSICLNGNEEEFVFISDPVNSSTARKMFSRQSWTHPELYWYRVFGAMATGKRMLITPSVIELKGSVSKFVLCAVLETMCYRPRYDGLVYSLDKKTVQILQDLVSKMNALRMDMHFDKELIDRCMFIWYHIFYVVFKVIF